MPKPCSVLLLKVTEGKLVPIEIKNIHLPRGAAGPNHRDKKTVYAVDTKEKLEPGGESIVSPLPFPGNPAVSLHLRPVVFRFCLAGFGLFQETVL
jgi:hypothetical protein